MGKKAVDAAVSFESAFAGVIKTTDGLVDAEGRVNAVGEELQQGFRDLALEIPTSVEELLRIGELGGQLGVAKDDLLDFTRVVADLGVATDLTTEEAAISFSRIASIMGTASEDFIRMGSSVVELGNNFETTEPEILAFATRIAGIANVAGLTESDIFAIGTAMTSVGIQAERGGTAVQKSLISISEAVANGNEDLAVFAKTAGLSSQAFADLWQKDASEAFTLFVEGLGKSEQEVFGILDQVGLGNERTVASFLALAGADSKLRDTFKMSADAWEENTALTREAELRYGTTESQIQLFKNTIRDVGISIGKNLLPILQNLLNMAKPLIKQFGEKLATAVENLQPLFEDIAEVFAAVIDAGFGSIEMWETVENVLGTEVTNTIKDVVAWFGRFFDFIKNNKAAIMGAIKGIGAVLAAAGIVAIIAKIVAVVGLLLSPVGLIVAAVAALSAAWSTNFMGIRDTLTELWEGTLKPAFEAIRMWLAENIPVAMAALKGFWDSVLAPVFKRIGEIIGVVIPAAIQFLVGVWENVLQPALQVVGGWIQNVLIPIFMAVADLVGAVIGKAIEFGAAFWTNILQPALQDVWAWISEKIIPIFEEVVMWIGEKLGPIMEWLNENVIQPLIQGFGGIVDVVGEVVGWIGDLADKIRNIELPAWLQPGSPTPFEIGLRGIASAMKELNEQVLPDFSGKIQTIASTADVGGGTQNDNFNLTVNSNAPAEPILDDFALMKSMARR
jgi:TP901 family phage tail tape measure protein